MAPSCGHVYEVSETRTDPLLREKGTKKAVSTIFADGAEIPTITCGETAKHHHVLNSNQWLPNTGCSRHRYQYQIELQ